MKLSVIIPAYNVDQYLKRCVDSIYSHLLCSDFHLEVIIVDDGSTDNTLKVAKSLSYHNLKIISQSNKGLSGARNTGIENSSGDYIWCIDSDDYITDCAKIIPLKKAYLENIDLLFVKLKMIDKETGLSKFECVQNMPKEDIISGYEAILNGYKPCSACSAIMSRKFIQKNNLKFMLGIYHEDVEFMYRAVTLANRIIFTDIAPYIYEIHPNTISTASDTQKVIKRLSDNILISESYIKFANSINDTEVKNRIKQQAYSIVFGTAVELLMNRTSQTKIIRKSVVETMKEKNFYPLNSPSKSIKHCISTIILNKILKS